jgi:hypothetical protein
MNTINLRKHVQILPNGEARTYVAGSHTVTFVPLTIRRKSNRKLLMPPTGAVSAIGAVNYDLPLIKTLGKAYFWQRQIDEGVYAHATDLAKKLKLEPSWVAEVLRLTLLAPSLVQSILEGRQPRTLCLQALRGRDELIPRDWGEQQKRFVKNGSDSA